MCTEERCVGNHRATINGSPQSRVGGVFFSQPVFSTIVTPTPFSVWQHAPVVTFITMSPLHLHIRIYAGVPTNKPCPFVLRKSTRLMYLLFLPYRPILDHEYRSLRSFSRCFTSVVNFCSKGFFATRLRSTSSSTAASSQLTSSIGSS